jgi:small conductance mechanosensitive channel
MVSPDIISDILPSWITGDVANVIIIVLKITLVIILMKLASRFLMNNLEQARKRNLVDETLSRLLSHIVKALIYIIGLLLIISSIPPLHSVSVAILTGAGIASIVIGMAAQNTLGNIISGISLAIFKPFRVGDYVTVNNEYGKITDLGLRHTIITTWDNRRLIIPNSNISEEAIINWSIEDSTILWPVDIGISYDSNIGLARTIMIDEAKNHPNVMKYSEIRNIHPEVTEENNNKVLVTELGDFAVNMKLLVWVSDRALAYITGCELLESIKNRFDAEGIEVPFPYRTIVYKKDLLRNIVITKDKEEVPKVMEGEEHFQDSGEAPGDND